MQSFCRLSTRWHQQFCRSPSFAGHHDCMQTLVRGYRQTTRGRPVTQATKVSPRSNDEIDFLNQISERPEPDIVVREYEQRGSDKDSLKKIDPNEDVNLELVELKTQMEKLERELEVMKQGPFGPQTDFMRSLPKHEREELLKALADEGLLQGEEDILTMAELDRLEEEEDDEVLSEKRLGVTLRIPKKDQAFVRHFNKAMREAEAGNADVKKSLIFWTWYLRCQQQIYNFSNIVSDDVWKILWKTQSDLKLRPSHIVILAQDMLKADMSLSPAQWMEYTGALHASGDTATAIQVWQDQKSVLRREPDVMTSYWNLGVRLYAALGRPLKAQEIALNAIGSGRAHPQILIPVIAAWARSRGPESLAKAWACYLTLREKLGASTDPKVFEDISNAFLEVDCADMALSVFKDMLLSKEQSSSDSRAIYHQASSHLHEVMEGATTEQQINRIGLSALLVLPRSFQNRYFFTSWIKKLIGEGRIDSAAMVVELMYEREITPDAKPLNGIIGAWLRVGTPAARAKAEKMAWAMIDARKDLATNSAQLPARSMFRKIVPVTDFGHARRAVFLRRRIPAATIETFSIMLQYYTRRSMFTEAENLTQTMTGQCQIKPNSFIMNHWLYADLRASKLQQVWDKYLDLSQDIAPDLETFAALWDTAKAQCSRSNPAHAVRFPSARQLFHEMMVWVNGLSQQKQAKNVAEFSPDLYEQIIRCFCLSGDLPGALAAMHGLKNTFEVLPDPNSIRIICGSAARLLPSEQGARSRRSKPRTNNVLNQVADVIETIETRRKMNLVEQGADPREVQEEDSDVSQGIKLPIMTEFICTFLRLKQSPGDSYQNDIKVAAKSMSVRMEGVDLSIPDDVDERSVTL